MGTERQVLRAGSTSAEESDRECVNSRRFTRREDLVSWQHGR